MLLIKNSINPIFTKIESLTQYKFWFVLKSIFWIYIILHYIQVTFLISSTLWFVETLLMAFLRFMSWNVEFYIIGLSSYITHPPDMWHLGKIETSKWSLFEQWTENMFVLIELYLSGRRLCFFHEAVIISLKNRVKQYINDIHI